MSGKKKSEFEIRQERRQKLDVLRELNNRQGGLAAIIDNLKRRLETASPGLRSSFQSEIQRAEGWLRLVQAPETSGLNETSGLSALQSARDEFERLLQDGGDHLESLATAFTEKADRMGKELAGRLAELERMYISQNGLLKLWCSQTQMEKWNRSLESARAQLSEERYTALSAALDELHQDIESSAGRAERQEEKHQKRLYVINALNDVCEQKGFRRIDGPSFENKSDRGGRIHMTFDTMAKGKIAFSFTLEDIHSESEYSGSECFEKFGEIEESLRNMFDIKTKFRLEQDDSPDEDKTAKDLDQQYDADEAEGPSRSQQMR